MKTKLAAFLIPWLFWICLPCAAGQQTESPSERPEEFLVHLEIEKLMQTRSGKQLVDSVCKVPYIDVQLKSIPESLSFLKTARIESVTFSGHSGQHDAAPLLEIKGDIDTELLFQVLSFANGYAKVQFGEVEVHHWVTNFGSLTSQFLGTELAEVDPTEPKNPDTVFLAMPESDRLLVSTSLAKVTEALSGASTHSQDLMNLVSDRFQGEGLLSLYYSVEGMEVPGDLIAKISDGPAGKLRLEASLKSRNEMEQQAIQMVASILNDTDGAIEMLGSSMAQAKERAEATEEESVKAAEIETGQARPEGQAGQVSITFAMNSETIETQDWQEMIRRFLEDCVECRCEDGELLLDVGVFWGPCKWYDVSDTKENRNKKFRSEVFLFNVYTTQEELDAAVRVAEQESSSTIDR